MKLFDYKEPYIYRDEDNKKWCVRYSIRYKGEQKFDPRKEYGRLYFGMSLNTIKDLKKREKEFQKLVLLLEMDLKDGIDKKKPETLKAKIEEEIKEAKKFSFDENFNYYMKIKGYEKPIPKKVLTANNKKSFYVNQLKPFLVSKGMDGDISKVTKTEILEFMNSHYLNDDPDKRWNNNTFNNKKAWLSGFFETLADEGRISSNPVSGIKNKEKASTGRFATYTKEERDILFKYMDEHDTFIATVARLIYYAYIRESELTRLKVSEFDLENRRIAIHPDNAKGQKDKLYRWVVMTKQLKEALQIYLHKYPNTPDDYMFGRKRKPSPYMLNNDWQYRFRVCLEAVREQFPKLFNRTGLSLYSLKHTGVTDLVNDNYKKHSKLSVIRYVQTQCRHEEISTTEIYLKKLVINIDTIDDFEFE